MSLKDRTRYAYNLLIFENHNLWIPDHTRASKTTVFNYIALARDTLKSKSEKKMEEKTMPILNSENSVIAL